MAARSSSRPRADTACNFDGVCYPDGTSTEDGCCTCDKQAVGSGCIEPGWCPGWVLIGKRCSTDGDCSLSSVSSGLQCRTDFFGERGVCTRDCNYGCPTGTECVAEVPDYNGGTIKNVCMRPCAARADCAMKRVATRSAASATRRAGSAAATASELDSVRLGHQRRNELSAIAAVDEEVAVER